LVADGDTKIPLYSTNYPPLDEQYKARDNFSLYSLDKQGNRVPPAFGDPGALIFSDDTNPVTTALQFTESCARTEGAVRDDATKTAWGLLDWDFVEEIARGLMFGASKYSANNYQKGLSYSRVFRAAVSHLTKWWRGTEIDEESGVHHLALCACNLLFAFYYTRRASKYKDWDDRPKG
jgi:hypothetical protein